MGPRNTSSNFLPLPLHKKRGRVIPPEFPHPVSDYPYLRRWWLGWCPLSLFLFLFIYLPLFLLSMR